MGKMEQLILPHTRKEGIRCFISARIDQHCKMSEAKHGINIRYAFDIQIRED